MVQPAIHPFAEHRFGLIQITRHSGILRAAAGEHENHLGVLQRGMGEHALRVVALQQCSGLGMGFRHHHAPPLKRAAPGVEGKGDIGKGLVRVGAQMGGKVLASVFKRGAVAGG